MQEIMNGKALKFRALAEQRVTRVIKIVRRIGNLSRRPTYDYSPEQVAKIFKAIRDEVDAAERKFSPQSKNEPTLFRLD